MTVRTKSQLATDVAGLSDSGANTASDVRSVFTNLVDSLLAITAENNLVLGNLGIVRNFTNDNAGAITIGQPVYVKSDGDVDLADADAASTADTTIGLVADASISAAASGGICILGVVSGFDTSGLTAGSPVYVNTGTAGGLTSTQPTGSAIIKPIGICIESHASTGKVLVLPNTWSALPLANNASLKDENANEWLLATIVASAVNYVAIANSATTNAPSIKAAGDDTNIDLEISGKGTGRVVIEDPRATHAYNAQTGTTYTLVAGDQDSIVTMNNASANTLTIPANSSVAFPIGTVIQVFALGAGATSIAGATGVTLQGNGGSASAGSTSIQTRYNGATIQKIATDTWMIGGDIGAVA